MTAKEIRCLNCRKEFKSNNSLFRFLASNGEYSMLCGECFKGALIENGYNNLGVVTPEGKFYQIKDMTKIMLRDFCEVIDTIRMNMIFSNPEKLKVCMKTAERELNRVLNDKNTKKVNHE